MALVIKGSTSGQVTIDVPSEAGTRAINFPAVSGNVLTDGSALPAIDGSALTGLSGGITQADIWRLTTNVTSDTGGVSNFERADDGVTGKVGSGVNFSNPYFSFNETGIYMIESMVTFVPTDDNDNINWVTVAYNSATSSSDTLTTATGGDPIISAYSTCFYDVTSTTNSKLYFQALSIGSGSYIQGDTNENLTCVSFIRLGDT
jgi:hypothetical protein